MFAYLTDTKRVGKVSTVDCLSVLSILVVLIVVLPFEATYRRLRLRLSVDFFVAHASIAVLRRRDVANESKEG